MTKKQLLATLVVSTLALAQAGVASADETTTFPVDGTTPVVVSPAETPVDQTQPSQPVETPTPGTTTTPATDAPVDPATPTQPSETPPTTEPVTPAPSDPADPSTTTPSTPSEEPKSDEPTQPSGEPTSPAPSDGNGQTTPTPNPSTKPSEPTIPVTPTVENPVVTNTGASIVSTQNGQLVLSDGSRVAPEALGAKTNSDKTISVTKADGKKATLPHTGEAQSLLSFLGVALSTVAGYVFRKKQA
ncbi:TPA: LPXTG cell wall anchor domain-containing protein [Streptococcus agalactiae]|nr:LPXTG cell wall anchor domain-containing protein [Streptococcus agalactiae]